MEVQIIEVDPRGGRSPWLDRIGRLRAEVWSQTEGIAEHAFSAGQWRDEYDDEAQHWIVLGDNHRLVAAARQNYAHGIENIAEAHQYIRYGLQPAGLIATPARIVVHSSARRQGIAWKLLNTQQEAAVAKGAAIAMRQASKPMMPLLTRMGCEFLGPALVDPKFPGVEFTVAIRRFLAVDVPIWPDATPARRCA